MSRNYIDFISAYCDNWCERCAFTERCSHFAIISAEAMCDGDHEAAIELAIGTARVPTAAPQKTLEERMAELLDGHQEPGEKELEKIGREIDERRERLRRHALAETSHDYCVAARRWIEKHEQLDGQQGAAIREHLEIIHRDVFLIYAKIMRALNGRDEDPAGRIWRSRVQNDWNGSAKVALISMDRSERAWRSIAAAGGGEAAGTLAEMLARLQRAMLHEFPKAMKFRRPGFDDPVARR